MAKKPTPVADATPAAPLAASKTAATPRWSREELLRVRHLGPAIIGQPMYDAAQALVAETNGGRFGPALLGVIPEAYRDQRPTAVPVAPEAA